MMKFTIVALALVITAAPSLSQAKSRLQQQRCNQALTYANGLRNEAFNQKNRYATESSVYSQLELNFYQCRENAAMAAVNFAETRVCRNTLFRQDQVEAVANNGFKACDDQRAAEKLAIHNAKKQPDILVVQPDILVLPPPIVDNGKRTPASDTSYSNSYGGGGASGADTRRGNGNTAVQ